MLPPASALAAWFSALSPLQRVIDVSGTCNEERSVRSGWIDEALQVTGVRQNERGVRPENPRGAVARFPRCDVIRDAADDVGSNIHLTQVDRHPTDFQHARIHVGVLLDEIQQVAMEPRRK